MPLEALALERLATVGAWDPDTVDGGLAVVAFCSSWSSHGG